MQRTTITTRLTSPFFSVSALILAGLGGGQLFGHTTHTYPPRHPQKRMRVAPRLPDRALPLTLRESRHSTRRGRRRERGRQIALRQAS